MYKIAYIDIDGTLTDKVDKGASSIKIDTISVRRNKRYKPNIAYDFFGPSFLLKSKLRNLKWLRSAGIELVAVTARDTVSLMNISDELLNLFDRVYYGAGLRCYIPGTGEDLEYAKTTEHYLRTVETKGKFIQECLKDVNVEYIIENKEIEPIWLVEFKDLNAHSLEVNKIINMLQLEDISVSLLPEYNVLELNLCSISKADTVAYDLKQIRKEIKSKNIDSQYIFSICMGDSMLDYDMIRECTMGLYPESLVYKAVTETPYVNSGNISKIVCIDDSVWMENNLKVMINSFLKIDRYDVEELKVRTN